MFIWATSYIFLNHIHWVFKKRFIFFALFLYLMFTDLMRFQEFWLKFVLRMEVIRCTQILKILAFLRLTASCKNDLLSFACDRQNIYFYEILCCLCYSVYIIFTWYIKCFILMVIRNTSYFVKIIIHGGFKKILNFLKLHL